MDVDVSRLAEALVQYKGAWTRTSQSQCPLCPFSSPQLIYCMLNHHLSTLTGQEESTKVLDPKLHDHLGTEQNL
uniref:Uncharacterized protein n=1 Tax=Setaria italica TaxID=4555 RepID=K4AHK8_SETIT